MAPQHSFLFDMPVRYVAGIAVLAGGIWMGFAPKDSPLVQAAEQKPKVLVRTASGKIPPGLHGSETEAQYQKRMGLATIDTK